MSDYRSQGEDASPERPHQDVGPDGLLRDAVTDDIQVALLNQICDAAMKRGQDALDDIIRQALDADVAPTEIADAYIPIAARKMGDAWCSDLASFAEVTIGLARLHAVLRWMGPEWSGDVIASPDAPAILVVVARNVHHTLGATILAGQLRRNGFSVRLCVDALPAEVGALTTTGCFDAVFVSGSCGDSLESLRLIVNATRQGSGRRLPVVLGGTVLQDERDVKALTGADHVTNNVNEAISFCDLNLNSRQRQPAGT